MKPAHSRLVASAADMWQVVADRVIEDHERHAVFVGQPWSDGGPLLIKASFDPNQSVQLDNEAVANAFLREIFRPERFRFPEPHGVRREDNLSAAAFEYVDADWYASKHPQLHLLRPMSDVEIDDVAELLVIMHTLKLGEVPRFFQQRAANEFIEAYYFDKLNGYLMPVLEAGHISEGECSVLIDIALGERIVRRFVHHDIVPWNLGRDRTGALVLVDAEFARWGMAYYDVAYFHLQTRIMLGDANLACRALKRFIDMFRAQLPDQNIITGIWAPLAYRLGANLHEALKYPEQMPRALELLPLVLDRDLDGLLTP